MPLVTFLASIFCFHERLVQQSPASLSHYIQSLRWDPAKSGALIAVDAETTTGKESDGSGFGAFQRKLVKVGTVSAVAPTWTIALEDADFPNPYQALTNKEKLVFLLATLSQADLGKMKGDGISPDDLKGEQRSALLSMIPNPLRVIQGEAVGLGFTTNGAQFTLPENQIEKVKLQLRKGVEVSFGAKTDSNGNQMSESLSSIDYAGPNGTPVVRTASAFSQESAQFTGKIVESAEKKTDLAWSDSRLSAQIEFKKANTIGEWVSAIRQKSGIELYADARIDPLKVTALGTTSTARDLLRGLCLSINGVIRQVGPAYVLTSNIEGAATREARLSVQRALGQLTIRKEVDRWKEAYTKSGVLQKLGFSKDGLLRGSEIAVADIAPPDSEWGKNWVPVSHLPSGFQDALTQTTTDSEALTVEGKSIPELKGRAKVTIEYGFRLVLPDGRPLESQQFDPRMVQPSFDRFAHPDEGLPADTKTLPAGSAVGIHAEDSNSATKLCALVKDSKLKEIWLDSRSPDAIRAAIASGLNVDLIMRPWRAIEGENCPDPDRTVLGQTGLQLSRVQGEWLDLSVRRTDVYDTSFSPTEPTLLAHWTRLLNLVKIPGIHRVILLGAEPDGYESAERPNAWQGDNFSADSGVQGNVPSISEFGFSTGMRLLYLRKHQIDPIDLLESVPGRLSPPIPFFENPTFQRELGPYPEVEFPHVSDPVDDSTSNAWRSMRHTLAASRIEELLAMLAPAAKSIFVEDKESDEVPYGAMPTGVVVQKALGTTGKPPAVQFVSINPLNTENDQGELKWKPYVPIGTPFCFDLSLVPFKQMPVYLRYVFK